MKYVQGPVTTEIIAPDQTTNCVSTLSSTALPLRFGVAHVQDRWFLAKALNTSHSRAGAGYFLAGSFVCGSFLCSSAEPHPGQKEEKMGAALIKAQGRVSSAVNSQPGGHSKSMDSQHCHHHQQLPIRAIGGEQKGERKTLPGKLLPPVQSLRVLRGRERGRWVLRSMKNTGQNCDAMVQSIVNHWRFIVS
ncbi:hypothetical protein ATANTOWER_012524 [Ataeniobius toweri]|uniref:Uncharacterized protein n=1 Tax=Ataeniobius toweri TaxID=208326 RepID=A0ABU7A5X6_9TELE|nr:hypothetical protein [Ataeniobius toweri]